MNKTTILLGGTFLLATILSGACETEDAADAVFGPETEQRHDYLRALAQSESLYDFPLWIAGAAAEATGCPTVVETGETTIVTGGCVADDGTSRTEFSGRATVRRNAIDQSLTLEYENFKLEAFGESLFQELEVDGIQVRTGEDSFVLSTNMYARQVDFTESLEANVDTTIECTEQTCEHREGSFARIQTVGGFHIDGLWLRDRPYGGFKLTGENTLIIEFTEDCESFELSDSGSEGCEGIETF